MSTDRNLVQQRTAAAEDPLLLTSSGRCAVLTLNRPHRRNAVTFEMFRRIPEVLAEAAQLPDIRALVLRGAGELSFSAGADIGEFATVRTGREQALHYDEAVLAAEEAIAAFEHPTVAQISGHCYGAGCGLTLACDVRFATAESSFAITPAKLGIVYPVRSTKRLVDLVGPSRAKMILMTGEALDGHRAQQLGLVDEVVPAGELADSVAGFVALLASRSAVTINAARAIVARVMDGQIHDRPHDADQRAAAIDAPDYAEGVRAFLERRKPEFG